ncbi:MAG TPA: hypothetical protein VHL53_17540 [Acidimicrobiia bacterium]|nr:hypothetical protein [Acidimicrobiia bacterium]
MKRIGGAGGRRWLGLAAFALGATAVVLPGSMVGAEEVQRTFTAQAEASGMYVQYGIPGFLPVDQFIDGGGPVSQATFGSDGTSRSFASLPYPGSTAVGYPGVFALVTNGQFVPPGYPFYVSSAYPTQPEQKLADPSAAYALSTAASESKATGTATFGPPGSTGQKPNASADTSVAFEAAKVTATATSVNQMIVAGPLTIGAVRSKSVTTWANGDKEPLTKTELVIEGGRAGDTSFQFGDKGLQVAQQGVPLPAGEGLAAINEALKPAGISVAFHQAQAFAGGAQAAAFEVTQVAEVPGAGLGTFRVRFGGAKSAVALGAEEVVLDYDTPVATSEQTAGAAPASSEGPVTSVGAGGTADPASTASASVTVTDDPSSFLPTPGDELGGGSAVTSPEPGGDVSSETGGGPEALAAPTAPPTALAAPASAVIPGQPGAASSGVATVLLLAMLAAVGLIGYWRWTTRRAAWTA